MKMRASGPSALDGVARYGINVWTSGRKLLSAQ